jgi:hypothetical protein
MSLCSCPERPRCEYHHCSDAADWSILTPRGRWIKTWPHGRLHFMCTPCRDYYVDALSKPLKGIDRPEGADDDWKGSIMDHLHHAAIAIAFEERNKKPAPAPLLGPLHRHDDAKRYTPAQLEQIMVWREGVRDLRRTASAR